MNIQTEVRKPLAVKCGGLLSGWIVTTATIPLFNSSRIVQIGHPSDLSPRTFRSNRVVLPVTLWANEAEDKASVAAAYAAVSYEEGSFAARLPETVEFVEAVEVQAIGLREWAPTSFVAFDLTVSCKVAR